MHSLLKPVILTLAGLSKATAARGRKTLNLAEYKWDRCSHTTWKSCKKLCLHAMVTPVVVAFVSTTTASKYLRAHQAENAEQKVKSFSEVCHSTGEVIKCRGVSSQMRQNSVGVSNLVY